LDETSSTGFSAHAGFELRHSFRRDDVASTCCLIESIFMVLSLVLGRFYTKPWIALCSKPTAGATSRRPLLPRIPAERALVTAFEDEVIDRLYQLNETRAADEARAGLGQKQEPASKAGTKRGTKPAPAVVPESAPTGKQGKLF
jgi:hypothetical protein